MVTSTTWLMMRTMTSTTGRHQNGLETMSGRNVRHEVLTIRHTRLQTKTQKRNLLIESSQVAQIAWQQNRQITKMSDMNTARSWKGWHLANFKAFALIYCHHLSACLWLASAVSSWWKFGSCCTHSADAARFGTHIIIMYQSTRFNAKMCLLFSGFIPRNSFKFLCGFKRFQVLTCRE